MTAESIARRLHAKRVKSCWMAHCPAHDDRNPSLAIRQKGNAVLVHCHAGCEQSRVVDALKARGLWESKTKWLEWRDGIFYHVDWGRPVAEYQYTDASGAHLYSVIRFEPKNFRQGYPTNQRWVWRKHSNQVLYHLPEVLEAPIVFLVEGEKDCETLRDWGFVATTFAGGAKAKWLPSFTQTLAGREVILIPDQDAPGRLRVLQIARALLGHAAKITVWEPDDPRAKDISDWFSLGHSELELIEQIERTEVSQ